MLTRCSILFLSLTTPLALTAGPYVEIDTFFSSEPVALDAISNDWKGEYHPNGEKQTASVWLESGVKKNNWSLGALYREEHQLSFSTDAADLYHTVSNDQALTPNRTYDISLDAYRFRGFGARFAKYFKPTDKLELTLGTSLFSASNLLEGTLTGSATADTDDTYGYQIEGDYVYDEDILFNRTGTEAPQGIGLALDLGLLWKPTKQTQLSLNVRDLAGAIHWIDAPFSEANANSDNISVDENGFSSVDPILTGFESNHSSYTQTLNPTANLSAQYHFTETSYTASAKAKYINDTNLFAIGGSKKISSSELSLHYWPQINTLETTFQGKQFGFSFGIDNLDLSETQTLWLSLKYQ